MKRAAFLDRDATLIVDVPYLSNPDDVQLMPGAGNALARLRDAGYLLVLITNQSGVGRGYFSLHDVHAQHARLAKLLDNVDVKLSAIKVCPHHPDDGCDCRKPSPKMINDAALELGIDLASSVMIGDKLLDVQAGRAAGCATILVGEKRECAAADDHAPDLADAVELWLKHRHHRAGP